MFGCKKNSTPTTSAASENNWIFFSTKNWRKLITMMMMWFACFPVWSGLLVWPVQLAVTTNVMRIGQNENGLKIFFLFFFLWALIPGKHENYQVHPMYLSMMMMATIMIFFWFFFVKKIWLIDWLVGWWMCTAHTLSFFNTKFFCKISYWKNWIFFPKKN